MLNQGKKLVRICEMQEGEGIECKKRKCRLDEWEEWEELECSELDKQMRERDRETGGENRD